MSQLTNVVTVIAGALVILVLAMKLLKTESHQLKCNHPLKSFELLYSVPTEDVEEYVKKCDNCYKILEKYSNRKDMLIAWVKDNREHKEELKKELEKWGYKVSFSANNKGE